MQAGTFPGGSDPYAIVNAPQQFVGSNGQPNATANQFAQAIQDGTLPNYGNVGNAVNFQSGQAAINNGLASGGANIGGNYFSDQFGPPTGNFVAPSYGSSTGGAIASGPADAAGGDGFAPIGDSGYASVGGSTGSINGSFIGSSPFGNYPDIGGGQPTGTIGQDFSSGLPYSSTGSAFTGASASGLASDPFGSTADASASTSDTSQAASSATGQATGQAGGQQQGTGTPINLGLQATTVQTVGGWVNNAITSTGQAFETAFGTLLGGLQNWFTRGFLIIVAVIIIAIALWALMGSRNITIAAPAK